MYTYIHVEIIKNELFANFLFYTLPLVHFPYNAESSLCLQFECVIRQFS